MKMKEIDSDQNAELEEAESKSADDFWDYIEDHVDELEDQEDYARKRGLNRH
jgi:hypothetical protein